MRSLMRSSALSSSSRTTRCTRPRRGRMMPILLVLLFAALLAAGLFPRLAQSRVRTAEAERSRSAPTVFTEAVKRDTAGVPLELPATVSGVHEASIFARTNGFVRELRVDIGSPVRTGDTLAVLDMPELREQERQALAVIEQSEASARLARTSLERWKQLAAQGVVTPQELDERTATANVTEANVRAAHANLANLREVQRFGVLLAPFPGIVTARTIDIGSLVVAGAAAGARPLLSLVQTDTVRVMLQVPQSAAPRVRTGMRTSVVVRDIGPEEIGATVVRTSGAIDPATRTLLTEVHVPNPQRKLLPGMYATVHLKVPAMPSLRIPAIALIVRGDGTQVARVRQDTVRLVPIVVGRDFGTSLEVLSGIDAGDQVVVNPIESLASGQLVKPIIRGGSK